MYYFFFVLHQHGTTFFLRKCTPGAIFWHFLTKFWALFEKVAGHTPNSPDIFLISKEYPTTILDVREASKSFNVNIPIFFYPRFSGYFFPVDEPAFFFMKFWLEKQHVFSRFVFVWCQPHLESFFRSPITVLKNLWNQKCFKIISDHHAKKIKWFA